MIRMKTRSIALRNTGLLIVMLMMGMHFAVAQSGGEQISWDSSDDSEETVDDEGPGRHTEALIRLNGEVFDIAGAENIEVARKDTLDIQIRHLAPGSAVILHMKKGGIKLKRKAFYANAKGQLDLEVYTGSKKVSGSATVYYTPSKGGKKERDVKISVK